MTVNLEISGRTTVMERFRFEGRSGLIYLFVCLFPLSADKLLTIPDSESFLFTLVNPSGSGPMKITPNPSVDGGIQCC